MDKGRNIILVTGATKSSITIDTNISSEILHSKRFAAMLII
jgi:hypothetical protein